MEERGASLEELLWEKLSEKTMARAVKYRILVCIRFEYASGSEMRMSPFKSYSRYKGLR